MVHRLPARSFVEFTAPRLVNPRVLWRNAAIGADIDFAEFSYCMPHEGDDPAAFASDASSFFAERYGGHGVGTNGGGARCGLRAGIQVKGIGRNPLVGKHTEIWHSHGGANLEEALREAIWGEITHIVLPFGGVRIHGIVATGTQTHFEGGKGARMLPRVLILREAALRPAHFMRAINHEPLAELDLLGADAERTQDAVNAIDLGLSTVLGREPDHRHDPDFINAGFEEMVRRFATQAAAARAKRIPHGAVNCSNIALDGRYLDFETMTTISDYGRVIVAKGNPDLWSGHLTLHRTIINLLFYVRNYLPPQAGSRVIGAEALLALYNATFSERLNIEFAKLSGIPESSLRSIEPALVEDFARCVLKITEIGNREPFKLPQMPPKMGAYHLNSIIRIAAFHADPSRMDQAIASQLDDAALRAWFIRSFNALRGSYLSRFSDSLPNAKLFSALNAWRVNSTALELCHPNLEKTIVDAIDAGPEMEWVPGFIASHVAKAVCLLSEPGADGIRLDWCCRKPASVSEKGIVVNGGSMNEIEELIGMLDSGAMPNLDKRELVNLCR